MPLSRDMIAEFSQWLVAIAKAVGTGNVPLYPELVKSLLQIEMMCGNWPLDLESLDLPARNGVVEGLYDGLIKHLRGDKVLPLEKLRYRISRSDDRLSLFVDSDRNLSPMGSRAYARTRMYLKRLSLADGDDVFTLQHLLVQASTGSRHPAEAALHVHDIFHPDGYNEYLAKIEPIYLRLNGLLQEHALPDLLPLSELQAEADQISAKLGVVCRGVEPTLAPNFGL